MIMVVSYNVTESIKMTQENEDEACRYGTGMSFKGLEKRSTIRPWVTTIDQHTTAF